MDIERIHKALTGGETTRVEFKSCRDKVSNSVYDTVCSFSNHSGGLIILGFDDDMNLIGVNKNASSNLKKNIINTLGNKEVFFPKLTIEPEIEEYDGKTIIVIDVPVSQYPVRYKNKYFDRVGDADMDITDNMELVLGLFERKNPHLFEDRLVPGLKMKDLDPATFKFCRNAATILTTRLKSQIVISSSSQSHMMICQEVKQMRLLTTLKTSTIKKCSLKMRPQMR